MAKHHHRILNTKWLFLISLFTILRLVAFVAGVLFFAVGAYLYYIPYLIIAAVSFGLLLLLQMVQAIEGSKVVCPNCRSMIVKSTRCAKARRAKKLFCSYSLRVAFQVVFTNSFTCQYCNHRQIWRGKDKHASRRQHKP
ncbi:hypothetical protein HW115_13430 [Verrucomicrobiaceae bacterium N1E253]|uniref:Uncharacterized protein n=1 Tax=Oceaniferula marina TaxID=2748318 RepID=A0A851GFS0_9BACT|nr:hypothetical protein [Oceaniferula marina]NWK56618.1 hypothetical protein [Oceaniferula marina]